MSGSSRLVVSGRPSHMNRPQDIESLYLLTFWTCGSKPIFSDFLAGRLLVDVLRQQQHRADTWAYVVMPDYLHWLLQVRSGMSVHKLVEHVLLQSTWAVAECLKMKGPLWRKQYHKQALSSEQQAQKMARTCIAQPRQQGLVKSVADYPLWDARRWLK